MQLFIQCYLIADMNIVTYVQTSIMKFLHVFFCPMYFLLGKITVVYTQLHNKLDREEEKTNSECGSKFSSKYISLIWPWEVTKTWGMQR